jgi:hypothetical protein
MTVRAILRGTSRAALAIVVAAVVALCGLQFEQIIAKNIALAHQLASSRDRAEDLRVRIRNERRAIDRLSTPDGAIPEIHDELRLVAPNEEVIYVRGAAQATPEPDWSAP